MVSRALVNVQQPAARSVLARGSGSGAPHDSIVPNEPLPKGLLK